MKYEKSCGGVIFKDNQVLLIQNKKSLHWSFPKGHMEKGETEVQTALREIKEEAGIKVILTPSVSVTITYCPTFNVSKDVKYFLARYYEGTPTPQFEEVSDLGWYTIEEALNIITFDQEKDVLRKILARKSC